MNDQNRPLSPDILSLANLTLSRADRKAAALKVPPQEVTQIINLHRNGYGTREIALRVRRDRKTIRRVLLREGLLSSLPAPSSPGKLEPYYQAIRQKVTKNLTVTRILREIRADGYSGGRTILSNYVRSIRSPLVPSRAVKRRFETRASE
jgi:transposase